MIPRCEKRFSRASSFLIKFLQDRNLHKNPRSVSNTRNSAKNVTVRCCFFFSTTSFLTREFQKLDSILRSISRASFDDRKLSVENCRMQSRRNNKPEFGRFAQPERVSVRFRGVMRFDRGSCVIGKRACGDSFN